MALNYTDISTIKNWFKTGLKPTQNQFWSTWESYWHKSEMLPISSIDKLGDLLDVKAETEHTHSEYAKNDATSLTAANVTAWQKKLGVADLKFDDKAITTTQNYADFGLVAGTSINAFNNAVYAELQKKLSAPTVNATNEYVILGDGSTTPKGDLGKNFANTDLVVTTNRKHTGTASVEFGFPFICSNPSIRYSGLLDKSSDATYNQLLGVDSNGYAAKVGLNAVTNAMEKSSDAQKDAFRLASRKSGENFNNSAPIILIANPFLVKNTNDFPINLIFTGNNLFIDKTRSLLQIRRIKDSAGGLVYESWIDITTSMTVSEVNQNIISVYHNFHNFLTGYYEIKLTNQLGLSNLTSPLFSIVENYEDTPFNNLTVKSDIGTILSSATINSSSYKHDLSSNITGGILFNDLIDIVDGNVNSLITIDLSFTNPSTDYNLGKFVIGLIEADTVTPTTLPDIGVQMYYDSWAVAISDIKNNKDLGREIYLSNNQLSIFRIHLFIKDGTYSILSENHSKVSEGFYVNLSRLRLMTNVLSPANSVAVGKVTATIVSFKKIN